MKTDYFNDDNIVDLFNSLLPDNYLPMAEWGAHIAAVKGYERGTSDAAEGKPERETLPYDIHRMYEDAYQRGYREGYRYGNEQPEF